VNEIFGIHLSYFVHVIEKRTALRVDVGTKEVYESSIEIDKQTSRHVCISL